MEFCNFFSSGNGVIGLRREENSRHFIQGHRA